MSTAATRIPLADARAARARPGDDPGGCRMNRTIRDGDEITSAGQVDLPFSLTCEYCNGGRDIGSFDQAINAYWCRIRRDSNGGKWNYLGICPKCWADEYLK